MGPQARHPTRPLLGAPGYSAAIRVKSPQRLVFHPRIRMTSASISLCPRVRILTKTTSRTPQASNSSPLLQGRCSVAATDAPVQLRQILHTLNDRGNSSRARCGARGDAGRVADAAGGWQEAPCRDCAGVAGGGAALPRSYTNKPPWDWSAVDFDDWMMLLVSQRQLASTIRSYQGAIRAFCDYTRSPHYEWVDQCTERFGMHPVQVCHEWNTLPPLQDYEGGPGRRPALLRPRGRRRRHRHPDDVQRDHLGCGG